jgi:putative FmdB family regulatory protein
MPLYEFKCPKCEHRYEKRLSLNQRNERRECPKCSHEVVRQVTAASFDLKGGGWAKDGYSS